MTPEGMNTLLNHPEARQEIDRRLKGLDRRVPEQTEDHEARQLGTGLVGGVSSLLGGTLGAILDNVLGLIPTSESVNGLKRFPEGMLYQSSRYLFRQILCIDIHSQLPFPGTWFY